MSKQPKILTAESFDSHMKLLNLPEEFKNTIYLYINQLNQNSQLNQVLINMIAYNLKNSEEESMILTNENIEELKAEKVLVDIINNEDGSVEFKIGKAKPDLRIVK